jgi:hypothetical protein
MSRQFWNEVWKDDNGAVSLGLQNTYTTAKSLLNGPISGLASIPASYMQVGTKFRFTAWGATSNRVTGPDTMTFQMMLGAVIACSSGAINLVTTAKTLAAFKVECSMICTAIGNGTTGKLQGIWTFQGGSFAEAASLANGGHATGPAAPAPGTGFDSTAAQAVDFFVAQSVSNAGNGLRIDAWEFQSNN